MGFYLEAYLRIYKMSGLSFVERQLISYDDEMQATVLVPFPNCLMGTRLSKDVRSIVCDECSRNTACLKATV